MDWWVWVIIAIVLFVAELFAPSGFVMLLVGLAFLVTGITVSLGVTEPDWLPWAICGSLMVIFIAMLRKPLMKIFGFDQPSAYNEMTSEEVLINESIAPGKTGQGELRGTSWKVRNIGDLPLQPGDRCKVLRVDGLTVETKR